MARGPEWLGKFVKITANPGQAWTQTCDHQFTISCSEGRRVDSIPAQTVQPIVYRLDSRVSQIKESLWALIRAAGGQGKRAMGHTGSSEPTDASVGTGPGSFSNLPSQPPACLFSLCVSCTAFSLSPLFLFPSASLCLFPLFISVTITHTYTHTHNQGSNLRDLMPDDLRRS